MKKMLKHFNLNNSFKWGARSFAVALLFYMLFTRKSLFENRDLLHFLNVNSSQTFFDDFAVSIKLLIGLPEVFSLFVVVNILLIVKYAVYIVLFIFLKARVIYVEKNNLHSFCNQPVSTLNQPIYKLNSLFLC